MKLEPIVHIENDFYEKFGILRQSGIVPLPSKIYFKPEYRVIEAFRGLEGYSHIWLIWEFSKAIRENWSPTVRQPRLGGNRRMGIFSTRSPFRPNPIGLSVVKLDEICLHGNYAPYLLVSGADLMNGTPIYDIKPYLPHIDSIPVAKGGFSETTANYRLNVVFPDTLQKQIPVHLQVGLIELLAQDPRPSYQHDSKRIYGFTFGEWEIRFSVDNNVLTVCKVKHNE
ncbi:MAG: tRNA (N6-threonylcarbamoyladenosine(37)-N6)-methyltransferase TrmO [Ruminococcus sp.]|nr:tRNA (N6-threonylcarbamoyladenosine(37)-N6)-methyltransferase TrmO [Ruminococcus sp.]